MVLSNLWRRSPQVPLTETESPRECYDSNEHAALHAAVAFSSDESQTKPECQSHSPELEIGGWGVESFWTPNREIAFAFASLARSPRAVMILPW